MKLITWNVRGSNKVYKQTELMKFILMNKVGIIAILEHRVQAQYAKQVIMKIAYCWDWHANYSDAGRGRIWVLWNSKDVEFKPLSTHNQVIHGSVKVKATNVLLHLIVVYELHIVTNKREMWDNLRNLAQHQQGPLLIMGDFNSIRAMDDRIGGNPVQQAEVIDFNSFMMDNNMTEMKTIGRRYTWTNSHIYIKIDWDIVNGDWINK